MAQNPIPDRTHPLDLTRDGLPVPPRPNSHWDDIDDHAPDEDDEVEVYGVAAMLDLPRRAFGEVE